MFVGALENPYAIVQDHFQHRFSLNAYTVKSNGHQIWNFSNDCLFLKMFRPKDPITDMDFTQRYVATFSCRDLEL